MTRPPTRTPSVMSPSAPPEAWLRTALDAADAAARVHAEHLDSIGVADGRTKGRADFVSAVDEAAQEVVVDLIRRRHPSHLILAEEDDAPPRLPDDDTPIWVVDPLDGTTNFLHSLPAHAASVAVAVSGTPMAGAVVSSPSDERWWALRGGGAWKNGRPIRVSQARSLDRSLIATGFPFKNPEFLEPYLVGLGRVLRETSGVRRVGSAAMDLAYVAEGRFDGFWEFHLSPWDYAAGVLLVEEAGGVVQRIEGGPVGLEPGSAIAAGSREQLEGLRQLVT